MSQVRKGIKEQRKTGMKPWPWQRAVEWPGRLMRQPLGKHFRAPATGPGKCWPEETINSW